MFSVSSKSIKTCNIVMRTSDHFQLQVFLYQTFLYIVFQSRITGEFQDCNKTSEIELLQKEVTLVACLHHEFLDTVLSPPLDFCRF